MTDTPEEEAAEVVRDIPEHVKGLLRTYPSQPRSRTKFFAIWDASIAHYQEVGPLRFKTSLVSKEANCSIGMIYRYFQDRAALLEAVQTAVDVPAVVESVQPPKVSTPLFLAPDTSNLQSAVDEVKTLATRLKELGQPDNAKIGNAFLLILEKWNL